MDIHSASVLELLGLAIRAEIDSNETYSKIADSLSNPLLKEKFQWLAFEENKHKEILIKFANSISPDQEIPIPDQVDGNLMIDIKILPSSR